MIEDEPETETVQEDRTEPPAEQPETVTLSVAAPFYCTTFTSAREDGGIVVIDRLGVSVPAGDAPGLIEQAAKHGVTLRSDT